MWLRVAALAARLDAVTGSAARPESGCSRHSTPCSTTDRSATCGQRAPRPRGRHPGRSHARWTARPSALPRCGSGDRAYAPRRPGSRPVVGILVVAGPRRGTRPRPAALGGLRDVMAALRCRWAAAIGHDMPSTCGSSWGSWMGSLAPASHALRPLRSARTPRRGQRAPRRHRVWSLLGVGSVVMAASGRMVKSGLGTHKTTHGVTISLRSAKSFLLAVSLGRGRSPGHRRA